VGFTLVEEVGRGGMGVVWRARDDQTGQIVALKLLRDLYVEDESYRLRFEHELEIARRITSPHVVKVLGYGAREGVPYIAFEFIDGRSLRQMLVQHGPYSWDAVRALLLQLAEGLADAHAAGVIHRDVKPSNILVDDAGTAKLADFGISRALDVTRVTKASGLLGTPAYLAPEGPIDARSDLYSLGVVAFELLAGSPPFEGGTYHEVLVAHIRRPPDLSKVPAEARPIVSWLLAKEPNARAHSARQLIRVLTGVEGIPASRPAVAANSGGGGAPGADQTTLVAPRTTAPWSGLAPAVTSRQGRSSARQSPGVIIAGAIAVIAVVGAVAVVALGRPGTTSPQAISPTQGPAATASDAGGSGGLGGPDPTADPTVAAPTSPQQAVPAGPTGQWLGYGSLPEALWGNGVAQLPDGRVAIFSASAGSGHTASLDSWILDLQTGNVAGGASMVASQEVPVVAVFDGGSVMIAGGWKGQGPVSNAEVLDGTTGSFIPINSMLSPRSQATATDIGNGRVLVVGGWIAFASGVYTATTSAEIFDRRAGTWSSAASMSTPRALASATRLQDGRVLVAGGDASWQGADAQGANQTVLTSAEIYDPSSNTWQPAGDLSAPRAAQTAALLPNGHVLVTGGWSDGKEFGTTSVDEYTPGVGWSSGNSMPTPHAQGRLLTLTDGRLLAVGGVDAAGNATAETDLYDPNSGSWQRSGSLQEPLYWPAVTVLNDGRVLVAGGSKNDGSGSRQLEIYSPPPR
jgi:eukaryotic-like serine/threonine-protein kinase